MTDWGSIQIGPVCFHLRGAQAGAVRYADWAYADFFVRPDVASPRIQPLAEMTVYLHAGAKEMPGEEPLFVAGNHWAVWPDGDKSLIICSGIHLRSHAQCYCRVDIALREAYLYVDGDLLEAPLRYPLDQILTWGLLGRCGGLLLHAAVAERHGQAHIFAGRSGAGKSTLSNLCAAAGWTILNDDRVMVFPQQGRWYAAGTPWHGSGSFAEARTLPLHSILFLDQADHNAWVSVSPAQARLALLDVAAVPWFEESWSAAALDALTALTGQVTCQRFHFTRTPDAVRTLEEKELAFS
jgi:hypothetical protein